MILELLNIKVMAKQNQATGNKAQRGGDTSRTSSQGRKLASGGKPGKKGNAELDETNNSPVADQKKNSERQKGKNG